jgi:hypothetical protein
MTEWLVNNKMKSVMKYAVMSSGSYYSFVCPDGIRKAMKTLGSNIPPSVSDIHAVPTEYESGWQYNRQLLSVVHFNIILLWISMSLKQSPSFPDYD